MLAQSDGLAFIRGKWVEIDHERLSRTLEQFEAIERRAAADGLSFGEAMRLLAGAGIAGDDGGRPGRHRLEPDRRRALARGDPGRRCAARRARRASIPARSLRGTLRPYQRAGVQWLYLLARLGLGACLADDMGLGKTIQVLSLLLVLKNEKASGKRKPSPPGGAGLAARQLGR